MTNPSKWNPGQGNRRYAFFAGWVLLAGGFLTGCSLGYLIHLGKGQLKILCGRESVEKLLQTNHFSPEQRAKILLVLEAKAFGERSLGLAPSNNYTEYFEVKKPPVAFNLTASPKLSLEAYSWCFPIVGCLPYKGFFDKERAVREEERMEEKGYDTYLRAVAAYSTLGWFKDPIFSTMLRYSDVALVETILHEMVHRTIFLKDQGSFNEGVATFVGRQGTLAFFRERRGLSKEGLRRIQEGWDREKRFGDRLQALAEVLKALYASGEEEGEKLKTRSRLFQDAEASFRKSLSQEEASRFSRVLNREWNNAFLMSYLTYNKDLSLWGAVFAKFRGDLKAMVQWLKGFKGEKDGLARVRSWLEEGAGPAPGISRSH